MNEVRFTKDRHGEITWDTNLSAILPLLASGVYSVSFRRVGQSTSDRQRGLMRKWFACIGEQCGVKPSEVHDYYCAKFLGYHTEFCGGADVCHGSSKLNKAGMTDFLNKIKQHAKDTFGIELPEPSDNNFNEFNKLF